MEKNERSTSGNTIVIKENASIYGGVFVFMILSVSEQMNAHTKYNNLHRDMAEEADPPTPPAKPTSGWDTSDEEDDGVEDPGND